MPAQFGWDEGERDVRLHGCVSDEFITLWLVGHRFSVWRVGCPVPNGIIGAPIGIRGIPIGGMPYGGIPGGIPNGSIPGMPMPGIIIPGTAAANDSQYQSH